MRFFGIVLVSVFSMFTVGARAVSPTEPGLLPRPQELRWGGKAIPLSSVRIAFPDLSREPLRQARMVEELKELFGANGVRIDQKQGGVPVVFSLGTVEAPFQQDEAYRLTVDARGIAIVANSVSGLYFGMQTLRQLVVCENGRTTVAVCEIRDWPAFGLRGFMQDVGRNFQTIDFLKAQIDIMAAYKYNTFHWHLSDHHGWRLESRRYPKLTADSSFERNVGCYYTQQEFREFLDYCWARGITVIPEFDSPGHSDAFRKGVGVDKMADPKAKKAMIELIDELCSLAPKERMPYIHVGTDEVRAPAEYVDEDYLPALHEAVHRNGREVIGWWKGLSVPGDTRQIQQTWASHTPRAGNRHIDSRSNYINHIEAMDLVPRILFQQPCRAPHGDAINLGGILCYWPDIRVADQEAGIRNSPVLLGMVAYSEAVWKGVAENRPEYWAKVPPVDTPEYAACVEFENRLAEQRDRFLSDQPFLFVKNAHIPWRLLGPVRFDELPGFETRALQDEYDIGGETYRWSDPVYGGAIHIKHFFGFPGHLNHFPGGKDSVWAYTRIHSEVARDVDAWIGFNTTSTSDSRAGAPQPGFWAANKACNLWINGEAVSPPTWENPGRSGNEQPITNEIYTGRAPTKIRLKQGWNTVLLRVAPTWKWVFSFSPVEWDGTVAREVEGLRYSVELD